MTRRETERLRSRIQQLRQALAPSESHAAARPAAEPAPDDLRARIAHLEQLVQGLQDSVYRESLRLDKRLTELETRTDPATLAAALSEDARNRGL